jgi:hypothetical protein
VCNAIKNLDKAFFDALLASYNVDLISFEGGSTVVSSAEEIGLSIKPSHLVTTGLEDINLASRALAKDLLRLTGAVTEKLLEDLIVQTNEALTAIQKKITVTWKQRATYFEEMARIISLYTSIAISQSFGLVEDLDRETLSDVASIGAHYKAMLKLAPRNVHDLDPVLDKFREMTRTIMTLEAKGTPQLEVLAQAKRLLGLYRQFLTDQEDSEDTRIDAESKIPKSPSSAPAVGAAKSATALLTIDHAVFAAQMDEMRKEITNTLTTSGKAPKSKAENNKDGNRVPASKAEMEDYNHRVQQRYDVLDDDGKVKLKRCGKFCRRMQAGHNPEHLETIAGQYCNTRCAGSDHPPWKDFNDRMKGNGEPEPGPGKA